MGLSSVCEYLIQPKSNRVKRKQRHPFYSDSELKPFFNQISQGYCCNQAADRCLYPRGWVWNTIYSDDEVADHMLALSMVAGAKIRSGDLPLPDRYDGLYSALDNPLKPAHIYGYDTNTPDKDIDHGTE